MTTPRKGDGCVRTCCAGAESTQASVTRTVSCRDCGREISGTVFAFGDSQVACCAACVASRPPFGERIARLEPSPCAACGRPVVWLGGDRRRRHVVCSPACRRALRNLLRRVRHEPRVCVACYHRFTPSRTDARHCSDACRQRAYRRRLRRAAA